MATQRKKAGTLPTPPPSTTPEAFQKEYQKNSTATIVPETDTPQPVGPVDVTGWPDAATCALFGAVFSGVYKGEDDKDSDAVKNFQKFLIDQLPASAFSEIGGPLDANGWFSPATWKAFQWWSYHKYINLVHKYAPGWGLWAWIDGSGNEKAWKVLQILLNRSTIGSNELPSR